MIRKRDIRIKSIFCKIKELQFESDACSLSEKAKRENFLLDELTLLQDQELEIINSIQ